MPDLLIVLEGHSQKTKKGCQNLKKKDIFSKYAGVILLKDKIGITITNAFQKIIDRPNHKRNKYGLVNTMNFIIGQWNHG